MSDCCSIPSYTSSAHGRHICPANGKKYAQVSTKTIKHHLKFPWSWLQKKQAYYFCTDQDCSVVYFGQDNSVIDKTSIRLEVGIKEQSDNTLVCYCFGVTKAEARNNKAIRQFVIEQTKLKQCACETRNPSGKCCLANFPNKKVTKNALNSTC